MPNSELDIQALDTIIGDDGEMPGLSQPVTIDEINDVIYATDPVDVRVAKLRQMKTDLQSRANANRVTKHEGYITEIDRGIAELTGEADGSITPGSLNEFDEAAGFDETSAVT